MHWNLLDISEPWLYFDAHPVEVESSLCFRHITISSSWSSPSLESDSVDKREIVWCPRGCWFRLISRMVDLTIASLNQMAFLSSTPSCSYTNNSYSNGITHGNALRPSGHFWTMVIFWCPPSRSWIKPVSPAHHHFQQLVQAQPGVW